MSIRSIRSASSHTLYVQRLVYSGVLAAISIVLRLYLTFPISIGPSIGLQFGPGYLPVYFTGLLLGPIWGAGVGLVSEVVVFFIRNLGAFNPGLTLSSVLVGALPSLFFIGRREVPSGIRLFLSIALPQLLCSVVLNTFWLTLFENGFLVNEAFWVLYQAKFWLRLPSQAVMIAVFFIAIQILMKVPPIRTIWARSRLRRAN